MRTGAQGAIGTLLAINSQIMEALRILLNDINLCYVPD